MIWLVADQANRKVSLQRLYWLIGSLTQPISRYVKCLEMPPRNVQQDTTIRISSLNNIQLASQSKRSPRSKELGLLQNSNFSDASFASLVKSTDPFLKLLLQGRADQEVTDGWQWPFHWTAGRIDGQHTLL